MGVWEKGVKEILGPRRDEETGEWRKLHNKDFMYL